MYRKILDVLTILVTISILGIFGTGFFTYRYLKSDAFKDKVMEKIMGQVSGLMPDVLDNALPDMTGGSIPTKPKVPAIPCLLYTSPSPRDS